MLRSVWVTIAGYLVSAFDRYEGLKKTVANSLADWVWWALNALGELNRKGLVYKRISRRIREYHQNQTMDDGHVSISGGGRTYNITSIDEAFQNAFRRRFFGYMKVVVGVIIVAVIDFYSNNNINLIVYGLLLDGIGALLIGRSVFQGKWGMRQKASITRTYIPGSLSNEKLDPMDLVVEAHNSVDATWGATLFIAGVIIQIVSILHFKVPFWAPF